MKPVPIYIQDGNISKWLSEAIAGALSRSLIFRVDDFAFEGTDYKLASAILIKRCIGQDTFPIVLCDGLVIDKMQALVEGLQIFPYGKAKECDYRIVHHPTNTVNDADRLVEEVLRELKRRKLAKPLIS